MPGPAPVFVDLTPREQEALKRIQRRQTASQQLVRRASIVLSANAGASNSAIASELGITRDTVITWRARFVEAQPGLGEIPSEKLGPGIEAVLGDRPRSGAPPTFLAEEVAQVLALACRDPEEFGRPVSHWTPSALAEEAIEQGIVERISPRTVGRFLKGG